MPTRTVEREGLSGERREEGKEEEIRCTGDAKKIQNRNKY